MPQPASESKPHEPPPYCCPWCEVTDTALKPVLRHMEATHPKEMRDFGLYPPIAGGIY